MSKGECMARMTPEEIDNIFPASYGGNAQISDLRLLLSKLVYNGVFEGGIEFNRVQTIQEMNQLEATQGDICLVEHNALNNPETYIWDDNQWKVMVVVNGSGGSLPKITEKFIVSATDAAYQEISLINPPVLSEHLFVFLNGILLREGSGEEYTVIGNTINFEEDVIYTGDSVVVKYSYNP